MSTFLHPLLARGFFTSAPVHTALLFGSAVAVVCGVVGAFAVVRGQAFTSEALSDIGATGGSAAFLVGAGPIWGFLVAGIGAAAAMELIGIQRTRGRDLATGIVLGAGLGLAALFLYLDATYHNQSGAVVTILFGSLFAISGSITWWAVGLSVVSVALVVLVQRPLLLSSLSPDLATARGIPVRAVGLAYLLALAIAVALAAATIGAILGTALLVGPAAIGLRLAGRPGRAMVAAAAIGVASMWIGVALAYDSYDWPPHRNGWPVSFFVVTLVLVAYVLSGLGSIRRRLQA